jgi:predicted nucleotidyltransferase
MGPVLSSNETSAIGRLKTALAERLGRQLVEIRLFGSKARGDSRPESDIDMLVIVTTDDWHICDIVYGIVIDIQLDLGVIISPKVISRRHFDKCRDLDTPFIRNVIKEGVLV